MNTMMKRLFNLGMTLMVLAISASLTFAQETEEVVAQPGPGAMMAMIGFGALAIIVVGLAVSASNSSED